jgi:hypothetical protein
VGSVPVGIEIAPGGGRAFVACTNDDRVNGPRPGPAARLGRDGGPARARGTRARRRASRARAV